MYTGSLEMITCHAESTSNLAILQNSLEATQDPVHSEDASLLLSLKEKSIPGLGFGSRHWWLTPLFGITPLPAHLGDYTSCLTSLIG